MKKANHPAHHAPMPRRSASADAALRAEIRRVERMSIRERMQAALVLGKGFSGIDQAKATDHAHDSK